MSSKDKAEMSRRAVLKALAAVSVCPVLSGCEFIEVRDVGEFVDQSTFSISDPGLEALATVGETACFDHGARELVLVRASEDEILAFDRFCPHQGQSIGPCGGNPLPGQWDEDQQAITCPWHGSTFNRDGELIVAPSTDPEFEEPIRVFPVEFDPETGQGAVFDPETDNGADPADENS